ncbi:ATP-binding protein [Desulfobacter sp.]
MIKKLPIGIDDFQEIISGNYCYVDKTDLIHNLVDQGKYYFLSRPRRFGKSLLMDTIAQAFIGKKELFKGLYLESNWDWDEKYPVIRIDFAGGVLTSRRQLDTTIIEMLNNDAESRGLALKNTEIHLAFSELITSIRRQAGQRPVVLVDEYDKPILDNITDRETATQIRDGLRHFYSVLKARGGDLKFVMLTGVSKFSKVSLFSGLNNLEDITLDPAFGTLCGYTQNDLETVFSEYIRGLDKDKIKEWYNGYNFLAEPVYNPFDVLLYLKKREFKPYWFETGTPSFLPRLLRERAIPAHALEGIRISDTFMGSFDVDAIEPQPLLFQTGYLTIKAAKAYPGGIYYKLGFPNHEVRYAFNNALLKDLGRAENEQDKNKLDLFDALETNNLDRLKDIFHAFFASIPHDWYRKNEMAGYEGYYCSVVYCYFTALGLDVRAEESTSHGRMDMRVRFRDRVYLIEFKVNELAARSAGALAQIKENKYHEKYAGKETWLIGVEFSKSDRNITRFEWEKAVF